MSEDQFPYVPRRAVELWQQKQIDGTTLMRCLVSHKEWALPITPEAVGMVLQQNQLNGILTNRNAQGETSLFVFSDQQAYADFVKATDSSQEQHFLTLTGTHVFGQVWEGVHYIVMDPASPHEIFYGKDHFLHLSQIAEAVRVEEALAKLRAGAGNVQELVPLLRDYASYRVVVRKTEAGHQLALAPDDKGRVFAAVFTSKDTLDTYVKEGNLGANTTDWAVTSVPGKALFEQLLAMPLDGIVFNCCGPCLPVAFAPKFAEMILSQ